MKRFEINSTTLHLIAMIIMLMDHLWATVLSNYEWLTWIGRIAFPLYAFMIVEGYTHTRSFKKYIIRITGLALLSEIPFNLMISGSLFYPVHQNVIWCFMISLLLIHWNEKMKQKSFFLRTLVLFLSIVLGSLIPLIGMVDYYHAGVLTVLAFYLFKGTSWKHRLMQLIALYWINIEILGGYGVEINLLNQTLFLSQQSFALLSLPLIWLYNGQKGNQSPIMQMVIRLFYPVHMLLLSVFHFM